jgi:histidyl-tRNA synthetase
MRAKDLIASMTKKAAAPQVSAPAATPMISLDPPSGTRDFFPEDMRYKTWLFDSFRKAASSFGFQEYDAPVLENEELYKRKAGEEITDQMYNFVDKEGAKVTLRPEMTPTLVRMVMSRMRMAGEAVQMTDVLPLKWFSVPQCWRFETTQRGRKREHYQWNCDIIGVKEATAELELLAATVYFFESLGITAADVGIKVNSRKIMGAALKQAGISDDSFPKVCVIVDKIDKIGAAEVTKLLTSGELQFDEATAAKVVAVVSKDFKLEDHVELEGVPELQKLLALSEKAGIRDWLVFDPSVVRGLAYYTGIVWEAFDRKGVLRAIAGGGRYDALFSLYGSPKPVPCAGFGFGDCVIMELLKERNLLPNFSRSVDFVVAAYPGSYAEALNVARELRKAGSTVDMYLEDAKKVGNVFKFADKVGARMMAFVAPGELDKGMVRIKDLRGGGEGQRIEKDVPLDDLSNYQRYF